MEPLHGSVVPGYILSTQTVYLFHSVPNPSPGAGLPTEGNKGSKACVPLMAISYFLLTLLDACSNVFAGGLDSPADFLPPRKSACVGGQAQHRCPMPYL